MHGADGSTKTTTKDILVNLFEQQERSFTLIAFYVHKGVWKVMPALFSDKQAANRCYKPGHKGSLCLAWTTMLPHSGPELKFEAWQTDRLKSRVPQPPETPGAADVSNLVLRWRASLQHPSRGAFAALGNARR